MLVEVYIAIQVIGVICLILSFIKIGGKKNFLLGFLAVVIFIYMAVSSADIQTETCVDRISNSTLIDNNTTGYSYLHSCEVNHFLDTNQMFFNIGMAFVSLIYSVALIFMNKGES